jgi:hypothetical protein
MDDNRIMGGSSLWIWILLAFLLFTSNNRGGTGLFGGLDCAFPNLFSGCNNNTFMWIIIGVLAYMFLTNDSMCGIFRNELQ